MHVPIRMDISATHLFDQAPSRGLKISPSSWLETKQISRHGRPHIYPHQLYVIPWISEGCCLLYLNELARIIRFEQETAYVHDCLDYLDTNHVDNERGTYTVQYRRANVVT